MAFLRRFGPKLNPLKSATCARKSPASMHTLGLRPLTSLTHHLRTPSATKISLFESAPSPSVGDSRRWRSGEPAHDGSDWTERFIAATENIRSDVTFEESADMLREITKSDLLRATDIRDNPSRFFEAHRILARHAVKHGPGFWIRFTVHYNLFGGTVLACGSDEQVQMLQDIQRNGELGCFSLTEVLAGVQSGLVVQTQATWDNQSKTFILNTPSVGARKNWISQGFVADKTVVLADLIINGKSVGPQPFLMDFRRNGKLVDGITIDDMGRKTVGNDLDNAWIHFDNVTLPRTSLLSRYHEVDDDGNFLDKPEGENLRPFDKIGQRLYTGRVAVAQAALAYRKQLFKQTKEYTDQKKCWARKGETVLSNIPQLRALYEEEERRFQHLNAFVRKCEEKLSDKLVDGSVPSVALVEAIATAKVKCVEDSIEMCHRLKQEVGSFALMADAGFEHMDFLQCCKFAEGDSRILSQKLARDCLSKAQKDPSSLGEDEIKLATQLGKAMAKGGEASEDPQKTWDDNWETVYALADAVMNRIQSEWN